MKTQNSSKLYSRVVFLGGSMARASVRIRCLQIAEALGCDYILDVSSAEQVPKNKDVFICVKPNFTEEDVLRLSKRGSVVWDIHDFMPPSEGVDLYIVGSRSTAEEISYLNPIKIIPQHHCNFSGIPNPLNGERKPAWIGRPFWCPKFVDLDVEIYNSNGLYMEEVITAYRRMGICLNVRRSCVEAEFHVRLNDGVKLINSMAFGIPSVSGNEPAYHEYGDGCTIFAEPDEIKEAIHKLQTDDILYNKIRLEGLIRSKEFHLKRILPLYRNLLENLIL